VLLKPFVWGVALGGTERRRGEGRKERDGRDGRRTPLINFWLGLALE